MSEEQKPGFAMGDVSLRTFRGASAGVRSLLLMPRSPVEPDPAPGIEDRLRDPSGAEDDRRDDVAYPTLPVYAARVTQRREAPRRAAGGGGPAGESGGSAPACRSAHPELVIEVLTPFTPPERRPCGTPCCCTTPS